MLPGFLCLILSQACISGKKRQALGGPTQGHPYSNLPDQHLHLNSEKGSDWSAWVMDPLLDQSLCARKWCTLIGQLASVPALWMGD